MEFFGTSLDNFGHHRNRSGVVLGLPFLVCFWKSWHSHEKFFMPRHSEKIGRFKFSELVKGSY